MRVAQYECSILCVWSSLRVGSQSLTAPQQRRARYASTSGGTAGKQNFTVTGCCPTDSEDNGPTHSQPGRGTPRLGKLKPVAPCPGTRQSPDP
eukprot:2558727-Rhodomonas_salina.2